MSYVTRLLLVLTSSAIEQEVREQIEQLWENQREALMQVVLKLRGLEINPAAMFDFETQIAEQFRELARQLIERVLNQIESDDPQSMPHDVEYETGGYRRLNRKTRNAHVAARLRHIAGTRWGTRQYMDMERLREQEQEEQATRAA